LKNTWNSPATTPFRVPETAHSRLFLADRYPASGLKFSDDEQLFHCIEYEVNPNREAPVIQGCRRMRFLYRETRRTYDVRWKQESKWIGVINPG
jgi:hypothetical protein